MSTTLLGWANLRAILRLWHCETLLFDYWSGDIHYVQYLDSAQTSCQHIVKGFKNIFDLTQCNN